MASNSVKTKPAQLIQTVSGGYKVRYAAGSEDIVDSQRVVRRSPNMAEVVEK